MQFNFMHLNGAIQVLWTFKYKQYHFHHVGEGDNSVGDISGAYGSVGDIGADDSVGDSGADDSVGDIGADDSVGDNGADDSGGDTD